MILTSGILCYAINPKTGSLHFLLGQEEYSSEWPNSSLRWCDFSGRPLPGEQEEETAAREFIEESGGCVWWFGSEEGPLDQKKVLARLRARQFVSHISIPVDFESPELGCSVQGTRNCFLVRVPWQPHVPRDFSARRRVLLAGSHTASTQLEKRQLQWVSGARLLEMVSKSNRRQSSRKFHSLGKKDRVALRGSFYPTLRLAFKTLHEQRAFSDVFFKRRARTGGAGCA